MPSFYEKCLIIYRSDFLSQLIVVGCEILFVFRSFPLLRNRVFYPGCGSKNVFLSVLSEFYKRVKDKGIYLGVLYSFSPMCFFQIMSLSDFIILSVFRYPFFTWLLLRQTISVLSMCYPCRASQMLFLLFYHFDKWTRINKIQIKYKEVDS